MKPTREFFFGRQFGDHLVKLALFSSYSGFLFSHGRLYGRLYGRLNGRLNGRMDSRLVGRLVGRAFFTGRIM